MNQVARHADARAFERMHSRMKAAVKRYVVNANVTCGADDIVQEVFIKLWLVWDRIRHIEEKEMGYYVLSVARNHLINESKKQSNRQRKEREYFGKKMDVSYHDEAIIKEGIQVYREAIERLTPKEKEVYQLHDADYCIGEIAGYVNRSVYTVNNQLHAAYKTLNRQMNKELDLRLRGKGKRQLWKPGSMN